MSTATTSSREAPGGASPDGQAAAGPGSDRDRPSLSLPTAGGAVRGMGEKFATNSVTGTGSLSVPVAVTPGRGSITPRLALSYDSGAGNGPFGLGWNMDVGSISRRTDKGVPRYRDGDVFQLSGAEDLVPAPSSRSEGEFEVRRYRPRTEGGFSRIERWQSAGDTHWRITTRDNVTSIFGRDPAARVTDPADPLRVFRWLLEETYDDLGNIVRFEYKPEDLAGVGDAPYEGGRTPANRYLKRIRYGNARPREAADFRFEVVLDYGEHPGTAPGPGETAEWPVRPDASSSCRSGFDIRTYRLCRRVLMFHHFDGPMLVRATELEHRQEPTLTYLTSVTQRGFQPDSGGYLSAALPSLEFTYSERVLTAEPRSLDSIYDGRWADIDGEGIPGLLTETGDTWYYRSNLGGGVLADPRPVDPQPVSLADGQLLDLAGDGLDDFVRLGDSGFHRRTVDGWAGFETFRSLPVMSFSDPNLRFVDLTGDGLSDLLLTADDGLRWHPSLGLDGFGTQEQVAAPASEEDGPRLVFADAEQSVYLADMTGDGLTDLVRIRNGEVCYWPNLGHGRFGPKVAMATPPVFDHPDRFDQRRIRLFDIDGSAPTDIVYLGPSSVRVWFNQSGNSWSAPSSLGALSSASISVVDVLGRGTACLVMADDDGQLRYLDLMAGGKPHLLVAVDNNMGLKTSIRYASSTSFYLEDEAAGRSWLTRLPFPVHVVASVETHDVVADTKLFTSYRYRHGFYDGVDREFRGFGYVEQRDAHSVGSVDPLVQPPAVVKRWQHTGSPVRFDSEYWSGALLPPVLPREHEERRALRGLVLREEVYAEDADPLLEDKPYRVTEHSYGVRSLQPGVWHAYPDQTVTRHSERRVDDPRVGHEFVLEVDTWGNVLRSAAVTYPRRAPVDPEQGELHIVYTERDVVNDVSENSWRIGIPIESREYEIGGVDPADLDGGISRTSENPFHEELSGVVPERRLIARTLATYQSDDAELPIGTVGVPALPWRTYRQAFAADQPRVLYDSRVDDELLVEAGYHRRTGSSAWWAPSGQRVFDADHFYLPVGYVDPFGASWTVEYDSHFLAPARTTDPLGNVAEVSLDYRVMQPWRLTDPNGNRTALRFDALGMIIATAVMGKPSTAEGDSLADPTTRLEYDLGTVPVVVHTFARERHGPANPRWQESSVYSDGTGRAILTKVQAEPGADGAPRWVGTGRTVYDNKGNPVKKYEPYFAVDSGFDTEASLVESGVTPILRYDPLGRLVQTDFPDGTLSWVVFDAWEQQDWDTGDTVLDSDWYASHRGSRAAELSAGYAGTRGRTRLDPLGRSYLAIADNGSGQLFETRIERDVQGNERAVIDARGNRVLEQRFDMLGRPAYTMSPDAGVRWSLVDVTGALIRAWDGRGVERRLTYDDLRRPTHVYADQRLQLRYFYGESADDPAARNLRTRPYLVFDGAGLTRTAEVDFTGNVLRSERRLARDARAEPDWRSLAAITDPEVALGSAGALLEPTAYESSTAYDALNRPILLTAPDRSRVRPAYNEANLLERVEVAVRGAAEFSTYVGDVDYNARGQRTLVELGSGVRTTYEYDAETFRLVKLTSTASGRTLQALSYVYDSAGNIVEVNDAAQQTLFFANTVVPPGRQYEYDPNYRLVQAEGREHIGQTAPEKPGPEDPIRHLLPHGNDPQAMRRYRETYSYDPAGNFIAMIHQVNGADTWRRDDDTPADSNRLNGYSYDANGNMTSMPHLPEMRWDADNRLVRVDLGGGGTAYYQYDASGQRVRATIENLGITDTRIYVSGTEIYRQTAAGRVRRERLSLHVLDGAHRIAVVETTTVDNGSPVADPRPVSRYQLADSLGSTAIEVDDDGALLSYEEYHPYGSTSFHAARAVAQVSLKRYRYTGKEKDTETGFSYHGARYYAPWLARWTSPDPSGLADGPNPYRYVGLNPIRFRDPRGRAGDEGPEAGSRWSAANLAEMGKGALDTIGALSNDAYRAFFHQSTPEELEAQAKANHDAFVAAYNDGRNPVEGVRNIINLFNPLYQVGVASDTAVKAAQRGDARTFGREATSVILMMDAAAGRGRGHTGSAPAAVTPEGVTVPVAGAQATRASVPLAVLQTSGGTKTAAPSEQSTEEEVGGYTGNEPLTAEARQKIMGRIKEANKAGVPVKWTKAEQKALRAEARWIWEKLTGKRVPTETHQVHHRRPLQYADLFPDQYPNDPANLELVPNELHQYQVHGQAERQALAGQQRTAKNIETMANWVDTMFQDAITKLSVVFQLPPPKK